MGLQNKTVVCEILGLQNKLAFCTYEIGFFTIIFIVNQKLEKNKASLHHCCLRFVGILIDKIKSKSERRRFF